MTRVQGENTPAVALGASNDRGIRETERQIGVAAHQYTNARYVPLTAFQGISACLQVREKGVEYP